MPFWSGKTIKEKLSSVIVDGDERLIDCAAYTMRVGSEYYVTPTDDTSDANTHSLRTLKSGDSFAIPPGQFAHVITHEAVKIPKKVLAFISIRTTVKWKGLINVSGFHVDPGYEGRLTFSVYNAGPASIHLRSGDAVFLIWFADLDKESDYTKTTKNLVPPENSRINIAALSPISAELHSLNGLAKRLTDTKVALDTRITKLEADTGTYRVAAGVVITVALAFGVKLLTDWIHPDVKLPPVTIITAPISPVPQISVPVSSPLQRSPGGAPPSPSGTSTAAPNPTKPPARGAPPAPASALPAPPKTAP